MGGGCGQGRGGEEEPRRHERRIDPHIGGGFAARADSELGHLADEPPHLPPRALEHGTPTSLELPGSCRAYCGSGSLRSRSAALPRARAVAASGKTSVIRISLRRLLARVAAPIAVTTPIGTAITTASSRLPLTKRTARPARPSTTRRTWITLPGVDSIASPTPLLHIR